MSLPRRAFLGAELGADAETFSEAGMRVVDVLAGGMAERAGVRAGDTIATIAGLPVRTLPELRAALRAAGTTTHTTIDDETVEVASHPAEPGARYDSLAVAGVVASASVPRTIDPGGGVGAAAASTSDLDNNVRAAHGAVLRTIELASIAPRALVLVIQGIACETVDLGGALDHPLAGLVHGWFAAGVDSLRVDKRGVGDSTGGPCNLVDFATELADARVAIDHARALARARGVPFYVFGHSVGGIIAALLARDAIDGVIVYGTPVLPWLDCIVDTTRRQLEMRGVPAATIAAETTSLAERLVRDGANGRTAAYHAQLAAVDIAAAWRDVTARTLVVRGEHDWVVRADDQARILDLARDASLVDVPHLDHLLGRHANTHDSFANYGAGDFDPAVVDATLRWLS